MRHVIFCILLFALSHVYAQVSSPLFSDEIALHRVEYTNNNQGEEGVKFSCSVKQLVDIDKQMSDYFHQLGIKPALVHHYLDFEEDRLLYTLATPASDSSTLDLRFRPEFDIQDQVVKLHLADGRYTKVKTVSEKEIVLSLMQHGRLTEFSGQQCNFSAFVDHVRIRQNAVAWAESLEWQWPDGGPARWNNKYWKKGTPLRNASLVQAVGDAFANQSKYAIGCYTATKLVMLQSILDYYHRIKKSPQEVKQVEHILMTDGEPLVNLEPSALWSFEHDFDIGTLWDKGKLLDMSYNIPSQNFVPGDWVYIRNTDPKSYQKTGYEGSNAIYLGRGKFDDYYLDHHHSYTLHEKLNEVYQWRNGVFSRIRDREKEVPLTEDDLNRLQATPEKGGLLMDARVSFKISSLNE